MIEYPMTAVVARREFEYRGPDGIVALIAAIGQPARMPDSDDDWYCPWQINAAGAMQSRWAGGVDAMQALLCALAGMRADLEVFAQEGTLTFLDGLDLMMDLPGGEA